MASADRIAKQVKTSDVELQRVWARLRTMKVPAEAGSEWAGEWADTLSLALSAVEAAQNRVLELKALGLQLGR